MSNVPLSPENALLPSLSSADLSYQAFKGAYTLRNEAKELGFYWLSAAQILMQISSETQEVKQALDQQEPMERVAEEIGDLLHAVIELCLFLDLNPETILESSLNKFEKRFNVMKQLMTDHGLETLRGKTFEAMALWQEAKKMVPPERIELSTSPLPRVCSTTELRRPTNARCIRSFPKIQDSKMADLKKTPKLTKTERRAQALRDNLKKRKIQQKARKEPKAETLSDNEK